ncbi:HU family DNA-binding protein [Nitratidesulfovibrio termitidis]|uniref:Viral histone-like protein n=1 Tax=Nitratidesulfovibrio termitidis HI1 TaxID=644897 RepID=W9E4S4_9BACT|nr:HU family DNA-binding protein [Nitratidesulfovibrio termitidis]ETA73135.1 bacterial nucleoid DNA-binding protein [Nitratidesulfovibrio termitidis HI1]
MNKKTMVDTVFAGVTASGRPLAKADVEHVLDAFGDVAAAELLGGGEVSVPGVGKLVAEERAPRKGRNPRTGEPVQIPARKVVKFRPSKDMKAALEG